MTNIRKKYIKRIKAFLNTYGGYGRASFGTMTISVVCNQEELPSSFQNMIPRTFLFFKIQLWPKGYYIGIILNKEDPYPIVYYFDMNNQNDAYLQDQYCLELINKTTGEKYRKCAYGTYEEVQHMRELMKSDYEKYGSGCDVRNEPYTEEVKPPSTIQQALALERELDQQNRGAYFQYVDDRYDELYGPRWKLPKQVQTYFKERTKQAKKRIQQKQIKKSEVIDTVEDSIRSLAENMTEMQERIANVQERLRELELEMEKKNTESQKDFRQFIVTEMRKNKNAMRLLEQKIKREPKMFKIDQKGQFIAYTN